MDNLEKLIKRETNYMFSDQFYENFTKKIFDFVSESKHSSGYVYFIKHGSQGNKIKIGSAIDIDKRIASYQTAFYSKIFIVGYIKCDEHIFVEKELHKLFSDKRIKGEWFEIDNYDLFTIKEMYDFTPINDYYSVKNKIDKMLPKTSKDELAELMEFCKNLQPNKPYNTSALFDGFKKQYPDCKIKNVSWFGRELNKNISILGHRKVTSTANAYRTFTILD